MKTTLLFIFVFAATVSAAQDQPTAGRQIDGLPINPDPGKCYVKCITHDEFKKESVQIEVKPEYKVLTVVPATYKWVEKKVLVKEASKKLVYHPAEFEWEEVAYVKKEAEKVLSVEPAKFAESSKSIEVFPKTGSWQYTAYADCASPNPEDCQTLCYVEKLPEFADILITPKEADAKTTESTKPEQNATYKKQIVSKKAWVEEIEIPAEYSTIREQVIDQPATVKEKIVPAVTESVEKEVLVKKGGVNIWEEIDCGLIQPNKLDILWNLNSANLKGSIKREIDAVLLPLLNSKPNISVELSSHTDSRGSDDFNKVLSQRRADAVKNYLISRGIDASRIVSKGYGESRLLNNCTNGVNCSERQHQINRRTEYRVIGG